MNDRLFKVINQVLASLAVAWPLSGQASSLEDFFHKAVSGDPSVNQAGHRALSDQHLVDERRSAYLPQLQLRYDHTKTNKNILYSSQTALDGNVSSYPTDGAALVLSQKIVDVATYRGIRSAQAEASKSQSEVDVVRQNRRVELFKTYMSGVEALERFQVAEASMRFLQERAARDARELAAGRLRPSEQARGQAELAQARVDLETARSDYRRINGDLCRFVADAACPVIAALNLAEPLPPVAPMAEADLRGALDASPDQQALQAGIDRQRHEAEAARAGWFPRVQAELERRRDDNGGSIFDGSSRIDTQMFRLKLQWDLFNGGGTNAALRRNLAIADALRDAKEADYRESVRKLQAAESALDNAQKKDQSMREAAQARAEVVRLLERQVAAGTETLVRLREVQLELVQAEVARQTARRIYVASRIDRDRVFGRVDADAIAFLGRLATDTVPAQRVRANP